MTEHGAGWVRTTVGELLEIRYGKALSTEERDPTGPIPVVGSAGRMTGTHAALVTAPAVLVGRKGSAGAVRLELDGCWPIDTTYYAEIPATCDPRFLRWQLHALDLGRFDSSTTTPSLRRQDLEAQPMGVPPLDEQRRIVDLLEDHLSSLDAAESLVGQSLRRLMALRGSVLAGLHDGEPTPLGELSVDSGYGTSEKCVPDGPGSPVVRIPNLINGRVDLSDRKRVASAGADVERYRLEPGDLLIVRTNGSVDLIGRSAVVQEGVDAAFASYLIRYQLRRDLVVPEWVHAMLSTPQVRTRIVALAASSAGQHNLSLGKLNPLEIPVPTLDIQDAGLRRLAELDDQITRLRNELNAAQFRAGSLRRSVLAAAFAGELAA